MKGMILQFIAVASGVSSFVERNASVSASAAWSAIIIRALKVSSLICIGGRVIADKSL